jgi:hypothetical protein
MRTVLILAALVALGGTAEARTKTEVVSLDGHCDVITLKIDKTAVAGADDPGCEAGFGAGYVGKVKGFGNAIVAGVQYGQFAGEQFVIRFDYPLVTGGHWDLAVTSDGVTFSPFESGTYTVEGTPARGARGLTSAASALRAEGRR